VALAVVGVHVLDGDEGLHAGLRGAQSISA
jgi:hypothetical protein